jgi:hypothetical protein
VFSGIFIAEELDAVWDKVLGDIIIVDVQAPLKAFLNMSVRSVCFNDKDFFWQKAKYLVLGILSSSAKLE